MHDLEDPGNPPFFCEEIGEHLQSLGWIAPDPSENQLLGVKWHFVNPAGTLAADYELVAVGRNDGKTSVTLTWPDRVELVPFHAQRR